jgi:hypothetical protein
MYAALRLRHGHDLSCSRLKFSFIELIKPVRKTGGKCLIRRRGLCTTALPTRTNATRTIARLATFLASLVPPVSTFSMWPVEGSWNQYSHRIAALAPRFVL